MQLDIKHAARMNEIRYKRFNTFASGALGLLFNEYGVDDVVEALGMNEISTSLGWNELPNMENNDVF